MTQAAATASEPMRAEGAPVTRHIRVRVDRDAVLAFQRATNVPASETHVPLTFAFCFLALPEIRGLIETMIGGKDFVPVHEAQSFNVLRNLEIAGDYDLSVALSRSEKPPRLNIRAHVATCEGLPCVEIETSLRIVAAP
jgi:hypothetical protein